MSSEIPDEGCKMSKRVTDHVHFVVPPVCQGQTVEVAYALVAFAGSPTGGVVLQRVKDRSDNSVRHNIAVAHADEEGDFQNGEPKGYDFYPMPAKALRDFGI